MRVFISSVSRDFEEFRKAAAEAAQLLDHEIIRSEDFAASASSPQVACLSGVRAADIVLVLLGSRYGNVQPSGKSPTHEEFDEATRTKQVFVFIQSGVKPEPRQADLIAQANAWATGHLISKFSDVDSLRIAVIRALNRWQIASAAGGVDTKEIADRALAALPDEDHHHFSSEPSLAISVVGAPHQAILRPSELDAASLHKQIKQQALFGEPNIFDDTEGTETTLEDHALILKQKTRRLILKEDGSHLIVLSLPREERGMSVIIEEEVTDALVRGFQFSAQLLHTIDPTERLSWVGLAVSMPNPGHGEWRTRAVHQRRPSSMTTSRMYDDSPVRATLTPAHRSRAVYRKDSEALAQDFTALLRRAFRG